MKYSKRFSDWAFDGLNYLLLTLLVLVTAYPLYYIAVASFSSPAAIAKYGVTLLWPMDVTLGYYKAVFGNQMILIGYRNTLLIVTLGTALSMILSIFAAYTLSRKWLMGRKVFSMFIVVTMFFSGGLIPTYLTVKSLGMYNTLWALIVPGALSSWNIIMMRTYFTGISDSLEESARMDGANDFHILFRILLPVCTPIIAVMILFYAVGYWNAWFSASIYLKDKDLYPLQLVLRSILISSSLRDMGDSGYNAAAMSREVSKGLKYATVVVATVPVLCIYPFVQRYFIKGIMIGSLKE